MDRIAKSLIITKEFDTDFKNSMKNFWNNRCQSLNANQKEVLEYVGVDLRIFNLDITTLSQKQREAITTLLEPIATTYINVFEKCIFSDLYHNFSRQNTDEYHEVSMTIAENLEQFSKEFQYFGIDINLIMIW